MHPRQVLDGLEFQDDLLRNQDVGAACRFQSYGLVDNRLRRLAFVWNSGLRQFQALPDVMRDHKLGCDAVAIGTVTADPSRFMRMAARIGGERIVDWLAGQQLPRIC